jgi:hypothetical protein
MKKKIISKKNILKIYLSGKNKGSCVLNRTYIYQISNILLTNQELWSVNKLIYKYTFKGERVVWLIDRHNIVK